MLLSDIFDPSGVLRDAEFVRTGPFDATFGSQVLCFAQRNLYLEKSLANAAISAVIVPPALVDRALQGKCGVVVSPRSRELFFEVHNQLAIKSGQRDLKSEISPTAHVAPTARISGGCIIADGAHVSDFAFLGENTVVEKDVFIGEGALVGVSGHFDQTLNGKRLRVQHAGRVRLASRSQVLAGAIVQRDVFAVETIIGQDSVIGPGVRIGHGVSVGENSVLTGGTIVAGYTRLGDNVWVGPGSTIGNNLEVGDGARIEIGSVVLKSVETGARVSGNFATDHTRNLRNWRAANATGQNSSDAGRS